MYYTGAIVILLVLEVRVLSYNIFFLFFALYLFIKSLNWYLFMSFILTLTYTELDIQCNNYFFNRPIINSSFIRKITEISSLLLDLHTYLNLHLFLYRSVIFSNMIKWHIYISKYTNVSK